MRVKDRATHLSLETALAGDFATGIGEVSGIEGMRACWRPAWIKDRDPPGEGNRDRPGVWPGRDRRLTAPDTASTS
jgi:hypothetical protein